MSNGISQFCLFYTKSMLFTTQTMIPFSFKQQNAFQFGLILLLSNYISKAIISFCLTIQMGKVSKIPPQKFINYGSFGVSLLAISAYLGNYLYQNNIQSIIYFSCVIFISCVSGILMALLSYGSENQFSWFLINQNQYAWKYSYALLGSSINYILLLTTDIQIFFLFTSISSFFSAVGSLLSEKVVKVEDQQNSLEAKQKQEIFQHKGKKYIFFLSFQMGIMECFIYSCLFQQTFLDSNSSGTKYSLILLTLGGCVYLESLFHQKLFCNYNKIYLLTIATLNLEIGLIFSLITYFKEIQSMSFAIAVFWGFSTSQIFTNFNSVLIDKQIQSSQIETVKSLGVIFTLVITLYFIHQPFYYILIVLLIFQMLSNISTTNLIGSK